MLDSDEFHKRTLSVYKELLTWHRRNCPLMALHSIKIWFTNYESSKNLLPLLFFLNQYSIILRHGWDCNLYCRLLIYSGWRCNDFYHVRVDKRNWKVNAGSLQRENIRMQCFEAFVAFRSRFGIPAWRIVVILSSQDQPQLYETVSTVLETRTNSTVEFPRHRLSFADMCALLV